MTLHIPDGATVLFAGDSVTDTQRLALESENPWGYGYVRGIVGAHTLKRPEAGITWLNRGISGNRSTDLEARWALDVLADRPDVLSILIGINDVLRRFDSNSATAATEFRDSYRRMLDRSLSVGTSSLILIEPFLLTVEESHRAWREDLDPKIQVVRELAREYRATLLCADGMFAQLATLADPRTWAADGIHPTAAGHAALASAWLEVVD